VADLILLKHFLETQIEIWRPIKGVPYYEVSNLGNLRSFRGKARGVGHRGGFVSAVLSTPKLIDLSRKRQKPHLYLNVSLQTPNGEKTFLVHRLVAQAFVLNPDNLAQVNHLNLVKHDCRAMNLEWVSSLGNRRHAIANGAYAHGEKHGMAKITDGQAVEIKRLLKTAKRCQDVADVTGVSLNTVQKIANGTHWKHV